MPLIRALGSGISGLANFQTAIDIIGNNIGNVNTVGFKSSVISFQDAISQVVRRETPPGATTGGTDPFAIGLGTNVAGTSRDFTQGQLELTSRITDMAINGQGFFILQSPLGQRFTRAGQFTLDSNQNLVDPNGNFVQGFPTTNGVVNINGTPANINIPLGSLSLARATSNATFGGNFNSSVPVAAVFGDANSSVTVAFNVFDSLGNQHTVNVQFTKVNTTAAGPDPAGGGSEWDFRITTTDPTITGITRTYAFAADAEPAEPPAETPTAVNGEIAFNTNGQVITAGGETSGNGLAVINLSYNNGAASAQAITLDLTRLSQLNGATTASITNQDGLPLGSLFNFSVGQTGVITGQFTNGLQRTLGQVALATFTNPAGLNVSGNNLFEQSGNSGLARITPALSGSSGAIIGGALENSNVDISKEFTRLIVSQRAFEANARIITASDTILNDLIQIVRA